MEMNLLDVLKKHLVNGFGAFYRNQKYEVGVFNNKKKNGVIIEIDNDAIWIKNIKMTIFKENILNFYLVERL